MSEVQCPGCGGSFSRTHGSQKFYKDKKCQTERTNARHQKWYNKQPREKLNEQQQAYRGRTDMGKRLELKVEYSITLEQWAAMVSYAENKCEICGLVDEALCVDHDHVTGKVRGVLCRACNRSIGQLGDNAESLRKAVEYLDKTELGRNVPGGSGSLGIQEHLF